MSFLFVEIYQTMSGMKTYSFRKVVSITVSMAFHFDQR
jgi:hypothetical protein